MLSDTRKDKVALANAYLLIFILALTIRIWFNFFDAHINTAFACDAAEYLRDAQNLIVCGQKVVSDQLLVPCLKVVFNQASSGEAESAKTVFLPLKEMSISGPVFPLFLIACYSIFSQTPGYEYWASPIIVQSILCAFACVLIASLGQMVWNTKTGMVAGLLAALYPGFIVNSGRLYSESFAYFCLCLVLWLISAFFIRGRTNFGFGLLLGISLFALQSTRSLMTLLSVFLIVLLVFAAVFSQQRKKAIFAYLFSMLAGMLLCILPWLALQKLISGKANLIVDRCGNYNLFVGNDVKGQGWLSIPYPDLSGVDSAKPWQIIKRAIKKDPVGWFKLMLDKPARLFKLPWNDFKAWIGPINPALQSIFHQLLLVFACIGIIISWQSSVRFKRTKILVGIILLLSLGLHLVYAAFITVPRYNLTAMPAIILFAAGGLVALIGQNKSKQSSLIAIQVFAAIFITMLVAHLNFIAFISKQNDNFSLADLALAGNVFVKGLVACLLIIAVWKIMPMNLQPIKRTLAFGLLIILSLLTLPAYCLPLQSQGRFYEWHIELRRHAQIERIVHIDDNQLHRLNTTGAYLVLNIPNGSHISQSLELYINGYPVNGPFIPAMALAQDLSLVKKGSTNELTVEQDWILKHLCDISGVQILDLKQWFLVPVAPQRWQEITRHCIDKQQAGLDLVLKMEAKTKSTVFGALPVERQYSTIPSLFRFSWEKCFYGVENDYSVNDPAYDQRDKLIEEPPYADNISTNSCSGVYLKLLLPDNPALLSLKQTCEQKRTVTNDSDIRFKWLARERHGYWLAHVFWQSDVASDLHPEVVVNFVKGDCYRPVWAKTSLSGGTFDLCFPMLLDAFPDQIDHIVVCPGSKEKSLTRCFLKVYRFDALPSKTPYEIL